MNEKHLTDNPLVEEQPQPQDSSGDMWQSVIQDMQDRRQHGIAKYGKPVQPCNSRNPLIDAYQEQLDLIVYLRQYMEEMKLLGRDLRSLFRSLCNRGMDREADILGAIIRSYKMLSMEDDK